MFVLDWNSAHFTYIIIIICIIGLWLKLVNDQRKNISSINEKYKWANTIIFIFFGHNLRVVINCHGLYKKFIDG